MLVDFLAEGVFPPSGDAERIAGYKLREQLFEGDHKAAFADKSAALPPGLAEKIYLVAEYPAMISRVCADMLVGEPPVISAPDGSTMEQVEALKALLGSAETGDSLFTLLYEGALSCSSRGDLVWVAEVRNGRVVFREVPAANVFVATNPDNVREVLSYAVAWQREYRGRDGKSHQALRVDHYLPDGRIQHEAFEMDAPSGEVEYRISLSEVYGADAPARLLVEEEDSGIGICTLVHVPNERYGRSFWGVSDYTRGLITLFDETNNRWSKIAKYLDDHSGPKVILPEQLVLVGPDGNLRARDMEAMWVDPKVAGNLPRYLTWDGQMIAAFKQLDRLADQIMKFGEISPAIFGEDKAGSIESGRAMKFRFIRTAAKVARKRMYFDPAVRRLLLIGQRLQQRWLEGPEPVEPTIVWQDGIPQDYRETVEIEVQRYQARLTSREDAIRRIDLLSPVEAAAAAARIDAESATGGQDGNGTDTDEPGTGVDAGAQA